MIWQIVVAIGEIKEKVEFMWSLIWVNIEQV